MKKMLFSAILLGLLSACASTGDKGQTGAAVEDKSMGQKSGADTKGAQQSDSGSQSAYGSQQHSLQAQRLLRSRQL